MCDAEAQPKGYLYDESKVPEYKLPDPLRFEDGRKVVTAGEWNDRRKELLGLFETHVYGKAPRHPRPIRIGKSTRKKIFAGKAFLEQTEVDLTGGGPVVQVMVIRPATDGPVPAFLGLNFMGNHTVIDDPDVWITDSWMRNDKKLGVIKNRASPAGRGGQSGRWSSKRIVESGYALVTAYYGDIDPDYDDGFQNGIHAAYRTGKNKKLEADEWGSIAGWAFGLSRILDFLKTNRSIDTEQVIVFGHSRLGKTALWASAADSRFAGVISNNSGCGGAALSRRTFGETVARINTSFPHWFCDNFPKYNNNESALPVDQHELIALSAPRPVYVASALKDLWADPRGEFLALKHASPVFRLLTGKGLEINEFPPTNQPTIGVLSYHCRDGGHDVTDYDWENYLKFADLMRKNR